MKSNYSMKLSMFCIKKDCVGGATCPMHRCTPHEMYVLRSVHPPSLRCRHCNGEIEVEVPKYIPEGQNFMYLEELVDRMNSGKIIFN